MDPSTEYLYNDRKGQKWQEKTTGLTRKIIQKQMVNAMQDDEDRIDVNVLRNTENPKLRKRGLRGVTNGHVTDMQMLMRSKNLYFSHNSDTKKECRYGMCTTHAINNAVGRPTLTYAEFKSDYKKHGMKDYAQAVNKDVNKKLDSRKKVNTEIQHRLHDDTREFHKNLMKKSQGREAYVESPLYHVSGLLERKGYEVKKTTRITAKLGTSYLVAGMTPKGGAYIGSEDGEQVESGAHMIAVRDGLIFDNNFPTPIPYSRRNLYKFIDPKSPTMPIGIWEINRNNAPQPKMIPVARKKRAATKVIDYRETKRQKK